MQRGKNKYMSIQLLDKTRKLNRLLKNAESSEISFSEISKVLKEMLHSNVLVLSKKGKILGISHEDSMESIKELLGEKRGVRIDASLNERLLAVLSTRENVYLQTLGFSSDTKNYHGMIVPIDIAGERLGTLFMYRADDIYDIEDIIVSEYGTTVVGLEMMRSVNEENAEENPTDIEENPKIQKIFEFNEKQKLSIYKIIQQKFIRTMHLKFSGKKFLQMILFFQKNFVLKNGIQK